MSRTEVLENCNASQERLSTKERHRLDALKAMDPDHPDFNVLELLDLHFKANPALTYPQRVRETVDEW